MVLFIKNGYFYLTDKQENETNDDLYERGWFVASQLHKCSPFEKGWFVTSDIPNDEPLAISELEKYYKMWKNCKTCECTYNSECTERIEAMEEHLYSVKAEFRH